MSAVEADPALGLGQRAPDFRQLTGADGETYSLSSFDGREVLAVIFTGNGCPTAKTCEGVLIDLQSRLGPRGAQLVMVNANNPYLSPPDTLAEMRRRAQERSYPFPYLKDGDGSVARAYGATRTPQVFVFDRDRMLRYRGRIVDAREPSRVTRHDLEEAVSDLLAGEEVRVPETQPFGCAIVW